MGQQQLMQEWGRCRTSAQDFCEYCSYCEMRNFCLCLMSTTFLPILPLAHQPVYRPTYLINNEMDNSFLTPI